jgi:hypothetical protein
LTAEEYAITIKTVLADADDGDLSLEDRSKFSNDHRSNERGVNVMP